MFKLNLVTPEKRLVTEQEIEEVIVPGYKGQLDILPGHAPLMTTLGIGLVKYRVKGSSTFEAIVVSWGYAEVHPEGVTILAETAESMEEIDRQRAEQDRQDAKKLLEGPYLEPDQIERAHFKMEKALARLNATNTHTH